MNNQARTQAGTATGLRQWKTLMSSMTREGNSMKQIGIFFACLFFCTATAAKHNSEHPLSHEDWQEVMDKVVLLEDSGLMPTLLPTIMRNRDILQLTDEQVNSFRAWRKSNYTNMVNVMNEIIEKMVQFRVDSLNPDVSARQLIASQSEIQELQRQLLKIKLSYRNLVVESFTAAQWENFAFVVADNPRLASLMPQVKAVSVEPMH